MVVSTPQRRTNPSPRPGASPFGSTSRRSRRGPFHRSPLGRVCSIRWPKRSRTIPLDHSQNLAISRQRRRAEVIGTISNGPAGAGVDWYSFQLDRAANVSLTTPKASSRKPAGYHPQSV